MIRWILYSRGFLQYEVASFTPTFLVTSYDMYEMLVLLLVAFPMGSGNTKVKCNPVYDIQSSSLTNKSDLGTG